LRNQLSHHAALQQPDGAAMAARWDVILLATAIAGGSMLIESSHRLDTGAPDEEVAASSCEAGGAERYAWKPVMLPNGDDAEKSEAAQARSGCPSE